MNKAIGYRTYAKKELKAILNEGTKYAIGLILAIDEVSLLCPGLSIRKKVCLLKLLFFFEYDAYLKKTFLEAYVGRTGGGVRPWILEFVVLERPHGYRLNDRGIEVFGKWVSYCSTIIQDSKLLADHMYEYHEASNKARRRAAKPWYGLSDDEQISVLRQYWSIPEKSYFERKKCKTEIFKKYGIDRLEIAGAIKKYGHLVKSVRSIAMHST